MLPFQIEVDSVDPLLGLEAGRDEEEAMSRSLLLASLMRACTL